MNRVLTIQVARKRYLWYVRIMAPNHKILLVSETYYRKSNAVRAARKLGAMSSMPVKVATKWGYE